MLALPSEYQSFRTCRHGCQIKKKDYDDFDRLHHQLHLAAGNDSGKGGNCVKPKLRSGR